MLSNTLNKVKIDRNMYELWQIEARLVEAQPTSRKVAGSIPEGVIGIFHSHNPSGRTVSMGPTQPLTEMNTGNINRRKGGRCIGLTNLPSLCADCLEVWEHQVPGNQWTWNRPVQGLIYLALPVPQSVSATQRWPRIRPRNTVWSRTFFRLYQKSFVVSIQSIALRLTDFFYQHT